jgi:hypothetical protein
MTLAYSAGARLPTMALAMNKRYLSNICISEILTAVLQAVMKLMIYLRRSLDITFSQ